MLIGFLVVVGFVFVAHVLYRSLFPSVRVYEYVTDENGKRRPVPVARLRADGTIIDVTDRNRIVGYVRLLEGKGHVQINRPDLGPERFEELGYTDAEGVIFTSDDDSVGRTDPEGTRRWWELFLLLHADIALKDGDIVGLCIEQGRFSARRPNTATLLCRGASVLLLYRRMAKGATEPAAFLRPRFAETVLPALMVYTIVYLVPGVVDLFKAYYTPLPWLGVHISYFVSVLSLFPMIWWVIHVLTMLWLSTSDMPLAYLAMINRETGIRRWDVWGIAVSIIALVSTLLLNYLYAPLFLVTSFGFLIAARAAEDSPWEVDTRGRQRRPAPEDNREETGEIEREYKWRLDSPLRDLTLLARSRFNADKIDDLRASNPFHSSPDEAMIQYKKTARDLVSSGCKAVQVHNLVRYIQTCAERNHFSVIEEIQAALDFVQNENIEYKQDEECDEIGNAEEYFRYPQETMFDKRGDCDCKSILAASLIHELGYPVLLLLSGKAGHAAVAVGGAPDLDDIPGLFFVRHDNRRYYYCETTGDGWKIGQETDLARQMRDDSAAVIDLTKGIEGLAI